MSAEKIGDQQVLLSELNAAGFPDTSLAGLRNSGRRYTKAVPILLRWLQTDDLLLKEQIVRALSYPWARETALPALLKEFESLPLDGKPLTSSVRWAVGNALETMWDDTYFDDLAAIASNRDYGDSRQMVVLGLGKSRRTEAINLLLSLLAEEDVNGHATSSLAKLAHPDAAAGLEAMLGDKRAWVRKDAKRGLMNMQKGTPN